MVSENVITAIYDSASDNFNMNPENCITLTKAVEHINDFAKGLCEDASEENKELDLDTCLRECFRALANHLKNDEDFKEEINSIDKLEEFSEKDIYGKFDFYRDLKVENQVTVSIEIDEYNELNFIFDIIEDKGFESVLKLIEVDLI